MLGAGVVGGLINMAMTQDDPNVSAKVAFWSGFTGGAVGAALPNPIAGGMTAGAITSTLTEYFTNGSSATSTIQAGIIGGTLGGIGGGAFGKLFGEELKPLAAWVASTTAGIWAGLPSLFIPTARAAEMGKPFSQPTAPNGTQVCH
jgi:hypothetical protein